MRWSSSPDTTDLEQLLKAEARERLVEVMQKSPFSAFAASPILPLATGALAVGIFVVDTFTILGMAIAVLYAVVVLMAANFLRRRGILLVGSACVALTVLGYLVSHDLGVDTALVRCLVSVFAIGLATVLALKNQAAATALRAQAQLLDLTHDTIFVRDMNDLITYWNRGAEELYGWGAEQAIGNATHLLLQTSFPEPLKDITAELIGTGRWEGELVHTKRDGTQVVVSSRWSLQRDERGQPSAILETNTDITERRRAEDALRRSEAYLAEAQRLSLTGSFGWKVATQEIYWSEETYRIFGYDLTIPPNFELALQRVHPDDVTLVRQTFDRASQERQDIDLEHRLLMTDGTIKSVRVLAHATTDASNRLELVGALMDVTATKRAHEALHQIQFELAHMNRVSILGELAASLAHEITQPIASARNNARAAIHFWDKQPQELSEVREALACVVDDADRAGDIIDRLRDHVKKAPPRKDRFDLNKAIDEVIELAQSAITKNEVSVRTRLTEGLVPVQGDRVQLQQVVLNLILNAVEAMGSVEASARDLLISTERSQTGSVLVAVRDSGPGIAPDHLGRVFEPFYTTKSSGVGMGLSICRSIIDAHGGRLWADVNAPRGALFQFTLPGTENELMKFSSGGSSDRRGLGRHLLDASRLVD